MASSTTASMATSAMPQSSPGNSTSASSSSGGPSSPLLFFVALGFGVVFTNLWIIVGVKYCFRYNQRNRARLAGDDPDAVDLAAMPRQRRRREKKLMTMEEVNEKFPLTKYKTWRSTRAQEGLPTAGGINTTTSRPASIKNVARVSEDEDPARARSSSPEIMREKVAPSEPPTPTVAKTDVSVKTTEKSPDTTVVSTSSSGQSLRKDDEEEEDTDQIQTAIPAAQLPDPGDTCAICIDALEDDDDIRGLTCGHAFHASCVDPWLTSRRACCPLCKADYYVPKPRPEGAEAEDTLRRRTRDEAPPLTFSLLTGTGRRRGTPAIMPILGGRFGGGRIRPSVAASQTQRQRDAPTTRQSREQSEMMTTDAGNNSNENEQTQQQQTWRSRLNLPRMPNISRIRSGRGEASQSGEQPSTPSQLEAGTNNR